MIEHFTGRITFSGLARTPMGTVTHALGSVSSVDSVVLDHDGEASEPWLGFFRTTRPISRDTRARRAVTEEFTTALTEAGLGEVTDLLVEGFSDTTPPFLHDADLAAKLDGGKGDPLPSAKEKKPAPASAPASATGSTAAKTVKTVKTEPEPAETDSSDDYDESELPNSPRHRPGAPVSTS